MIYVEIYSLPCLLFQCNFFRNYMYIMNLKILLLIGIILFALICSNSTKESLVSNMTLQSGQNQNIDFKALDNIVKRFKKPVITARYAPLNLQKCKNRGWIEVSILINAHYNIWKTNNNHTLNINDRQMQGDPCKYNSKTLYIDVNERP